MEEMYGYTAPDFFGIDDLLDLSNDHIFTHIPTSSVDHTSAMHASDFTNEICVPQNENENDDQVAQLEWLSNFVDDTSYTDFPGAPNWPPPSMTNNTLTTSIPQHAISSSHARRCTHCASEKTPQWRTGPLGPKTLCNACGVRYKSGRLVPEYRPAASPTFVLTQHSNSHRKVMELRRQKQEQDGRHHHRNYQVCS